MFELKICFFGATSIVKNSDKEKLKYSSYWIAFDGAGSWNIGNGFAKSVAIFGVDVSSLTHADNRKNNFVVLGESPTYGINGNFASPEKKVSINFSKAKKKKMFEFTL